MKPFDLEKAIAGHPLVTRDGREVTEFHYFKNVIKGYNCAAAVDGSLLMRTADGLLYENSESYLDIFLASVKKEAWINMYRTKAGTVYFGDVYLGRDLVESARMGKSDFVRSILVLEWEE